MILVTDGNNQATTNHLSTSNDDESSEKLDNLKILLNAVRGTLGKLEKEVQTIKRNVRHANGPKQHQPQPQFALLNPVIDKQADRSGACAANDLNSESGVIRIRKDFFAFCDMDGDDGGGWIVIQNRFDGSTDFYRNWSDYREGFGNIAGEFWMGLEKIYELTSSNLHELMVVMENFDGEKKFAKYAAFGIAGESNFYALNILGKHSGDVEDSLSYHAGMKFSTFE